MSETISNMKRQLLTRLGKQESEFFILMSGCTKSPYVVCDPETFDDEIFLYFTEEDARQAHKRLTEEKIPVNLMKIETKQMLLFFTSLYTMGVNAMLITWNGETEVIQVNDIVRKKSQDQMPEGAVWVENPELHLTALYFAQMLRSPRKDPENFQSRVAELQEELTAYFRRGRFIFALGRENEGTPLIRQKDGNVFQPIFTDVMEFQRFNRENKFKPVVVDGEKLPQVLVREARGVILNLMSVNLPLMVGRPVKQEGPGANASSGSGSAAAPSGSGAVLTGNGPASSGAPISAGSIEAVVAQAMENTRQK